VTGSTGFVGRALLPLLTRKGVVVRQAVRQRTGDVEHRNRELFGFDLLDPHTDWTPALQGMDAVIHLAGQVPTLNKGMDPGFSGYAAANFRSTENLAEQAAGMGVRRFVFISTIKVLGEISQDAVLTDQTPVNPEDGYALSKLKAEACLRDIEDRSGMEVVILRPPLVYGPHVKGNFLMLLNLVYRGIPLPFKEIENRQQLIALDNLADALALCVSHDRAAGRTFLVSDRESVSTAGLVEKISRAMGRNPGNFYLPAGVSKVLFYALGKKALYDKLWRSYRIDCKPVSNLLGWQPCVSMDEGIHRTVHWYLNTKPCKGNTL
jgi:nucleoside-diphosphate-sugar epimerase